MPIFDIYSKRQKRLRGEVPDVFQYDDFPEPFCNQVIHILKDTLGEVIYNDTPSAQAYDEIRKILCREYGVFELSKKSHSGTSSYFDILAFLSECNDHEKILDVIETSFMIANRVTQDYNFQHQFNTPITLNEAIDELNQRFLESGLGYQYENRKIVRIDSKLIHAEVVKPALALLSNKMYEGANDEYLIAHEHYRHHRDKDCLIYCNKAFESVMKAICDKHKWVYNEGDTAKRLLEICFEKELVPSFLQTHFTSLRSGLESGIPTVRNKLAGHGQGVEQVKVPPFMAAYLLHLTATSILFLADAEQTMK